MNVLSKAWQSFRAVQWRTGPGGNNEKISRTSERVSSNRGTELLTREKEEEPPTTPAVVSPPFFSLDSSWHSIAAARPDYPRHSVDAFTKRTDTKRRCTPVESIPAQLSVTMGSNDVLLFPTIGSQQAS